MIILKFYREDMLVRTEICTNAFEADLIAEKEGQAYTKIVLEYQQKDADAI